MESKLNNVLQALTKLAEESNFVVISADEIRNIMAENNNISDKELDELILYLKKRSFIQLKYSSSNTYCLALLPKAIVYKEDGINSLDETKVLKQVVEKKDKWLIFKILIITIISAFAGASAAIYLLLLM